MKWLIRQFDPVFLLIMAFVVVIYTAMFFEQFLGIIH